MKAESVVKATNGNYQGRNSTADRAIDILMLFSEQQPVLTAEQIADRLDLSRSTTYRYLSSLRAYGLIEEEKGDFRLGLKILQMARTVRRGLSPVEIALPLMRELAAPTGEAVILTRQAGSQVICIERVESSHPVRLSYERGMALPLHAGSGAKILLAYLDPTEIDRLLAKEPLTRFTPNTITDPEKLKEELAQIRQAGYVLCEGEIDPGITGIGAPIRNAEGRVVAGLSIAGPTYRLEKHDIGLVIKDVVAAAGRISQRLTELDF